MSVSKSFQLSEESARALEDQVSAGLAPTQTAVVEELIRHERLRLQIRLDEEMLDREWREAMADPAYRADVDAVETEFADADAEAWTALP